ncbi:hypothetical protein ACU4IU_00395 [Brevibacterium sp. CSND-B09]|uniref:hypothetical protein n=1 Tax=Brevibacterium sp. CSND-B09 TaxID=3462571 RepID=UPI00406A668F
MSDQDNLLERIADAIEAAGYQWDFMMESHLMDPRVWLDPGEKSTFQAAAVYAALAEEEANA